jgi:predicted ArsR family transcriptional regulator
MDKTKNSDAIIARIKQQGPMTSGELAKELDMTSMGARQHLLRLEEKSLVSNFLQKASVGRPKQMWQLTEKSQKKFPDRHADLTLHLIDSVQSIFGKQGLEKLIGAREEKIQQQYSNELEYIDELADKVEKLAELRCQEGYMASTEKVNDNEYLLIENHCPICSAAQQCQNFCRSELAIFQQCFGDSYHVERCEYLFSGDRRCVYKISTVS